MVDELECRLEAEPEYRLGDEIAIRFSLTNRASHGVWVLKWNTPLDAIESNCFVVTRHNEDVRYDGILVQRGDPRSNEYVHLDPGETVSNTVDLSIAYPISQSGLYQLAAKLRLHDVFRETGDPVEIPRPRSIHESLKLDCNQVEFRVVGEGPPRLTEGHRVREKENSATRRKRVIPESGAGSNKAMEPIIVEGNDEEEAQVLSAHAGAYFKTLSATANLNADASSGNDLYTTWFGDYNSSRFDTVQENYVRITDALVNWEFTYNCDGPRCADDSSIVAYTFILGSTIYLCKPFWSELPTSDDSQIETVVHELSHNVTFTDDNAYGSDACKKLADKDPSAAINNADNYGHFADNTPVIEWGDSIRYDTGAQLAVAMDNDGNIVEVHCAEGGSENHFYLVGKLNASKKTISWGDSIRYDTGGQLSVAMDNKGNIVEVHRGYGNPENHYYLVGKLNTDEKKISWGKSIRYDTGSTLAVAMDNSGNIVEVHCGYGNPENHYYLVGKLHASTRTITWGKSTRYDTGSALAVAMDDRGNIVEVHRGYGNPNNHYYLVGKLNAANKSISWGDSIRYDTGSLLAVAMDNVGNVVEVHCGERNETVFPLEFAASHFYVVGALSKDYLDESPPTVAWGASRKYDKGVGLAVAMDDKGNVVEVHGAGEGSDNHFYLVGKVLFPR